MSVFPFIEAEKCQRRNVAKANAGATGGARAGKATPAITYGHNKDHRPESSNCCASCRARSPWPNASAFGSSIARSVMNQGAAHFDSEVTTWRHSVQ